MIVQCPKCKTSYKAADELIKDSSPAFRCSRCKHTFQLESAEPRSEPTVESPPRETPAQNHQAGELSFVFPPKELAQDVTANVPSIDVPTRHSDTEAAAENQRSEQWEVGGNEEKSEDPPTISEASDPTRKKEPRESFDPSNFPMQLTPAAESTPTSADGAENILRLGPYQDQQTSTKPYVTLFALLIIIFALVTAFNRVHPSATEGFVRQIPLVGASVLRNNRLRDGVLLQSLRGGYQFIQGNREVFVITGAVLNQNPVAIRAVQISAESFNNQNEEIEKQTIWVGNAISPNIVRGLTLQEISNLQRLPPLKSFEIPPGDSVPFAIVFLKTPKGMKDFGCKVISAEGDG